MEVARSTDVEASSSTSQPRLKWWNCSTQICSTALGTMRLRAVSVRSFVDPTTDVAGLSRGRWRDVRNVTHIYLSSFLCPSGSVSKMNISGSCHPPARTINQPELDHGHAEGHPLSTIVLCVVHNSRLVVQIKILNNWTPSSPLKLRHNSQSSRGFTRHFGTHVRQHFAQHTLCSCLQI